MTMIMMKKRRRLSVPNCQTPILPYIPLGAQLVVSELGTRWPNEFQFGTIGANQSVLSCVSVWPHFIQENAINCKHTHTAAHTSQFHIHVALRSLCFGFSVQPRVKESVRAAESEMMIIIGNRLKALSVR